MGQVVFLFSGSNLLSVLGKSIFETTTLFQKKKRKLYQHRPQIAWKGIIDFPAICFKLQTDPKKRTKIKTSSAPCGPPPSKRVLLSHFFINFPLPPTKIPLSSIAKQREKQNPPARQKESTFFELHFFSRKNRMLEVNPQDIFGGENAFKNLGDAVFF